LETGTAIASLQADLTAIAPSVGRADSGRQLASVISSERTDSTPPEPLRPYSDDYWRALADLDIVSSRIVARGEAEVAFAEAVARLAAGNYEEAARLFSAMSTQATDTPVAAAAQAMLAATLMHQHKWQELRDLSVALNLTSVF